MSIIGGTSLSLMDVARRTDGDGKIAKIVEILSEQNSILEDMMFEQCNNGMIHRTTVRTGLPAGTWRRLYGGVQSEKSTTEQIQDSCGMLETYSKVDKALADMSPDKGAFLLSESVSFLEGLSQTMAETLIYGNEKNDKAKFTGLAARYSSLSTDEKKIGFNVIDGGGTGTDEYFDLRPELGQSDDARPLSEGLEGGRDRRRPRSADGAGQGRKGFRGLRHAL